MSHRAFLAARLLCFLCIAKCVTMQANKDVLFCFYVGFMSKVHILNIRLTKSFWWLPPPAQETAAPLPKGRW